MDFASRGGKKMGKKSQNKSSSALMKVVYISSPMKVKTSASRFRTLVQELTGRDSDISRYPTSSDSSTDSQFEDFEIMPEFKRASSKSNLDLHHHHQNHHQQQQKGVFVNSPSSSESMVEQEQEHDDRQPPTFDDAFISEGFFQGLLASDLLFSTDSSRDQFDVLEMKLFSAKRAPLFPE